MVDLIILGVLFLALLVSIVVENHRPPETGYKLGDVSGASHPFRK